ncbi:MAG TPA: hypothetical protein VJW76_06495 [Verrucomicrobiae bacterium]|nr:hypothetical protein [Verrucomicrobiae bacterium]
MRNRRSIDIISILVAGAALVTIALFSWDFRPPVDRGLHAEIGRALAKEALSLARPGAEITVITRDTEAFRQPALDILLKSFQQEIGRAGSIAVTTHALQLDPLRPVEVPPGDFYELIRRSPADRIIVSFLGPPALTEEQRGALGTVKPKIIALCSGNLAESLDLQELFKAGLLHAALVNRRPAPGAADVSRKSSGAFDGLYTIVRGDPSSERSHAGR